MSSCHLPLHAPILDLSNKSEISDLADVNPMEPSCQAWGRLWFEEWQIK
jgi:hypothetical protein